MRLYHYLETKWALDNIRRRRLKLSKIDDMNDPWEWKSLYSTDEPTRSALEHTMQRMAERVGVTCFSRRWNNILMWGHYGEKHKGICLGFDVADDDRTRRVRYDSRVEQIGQLSGSSRSEIVAEGTRILNTLYCTKYSGWRYEKEFRIQGQRKEKDEETGFYFVPFNDDLRLKEVIAGARYQMSKKPIEDALNGYSEDVKIVKATISSSQFRIVIDKNGFRDPEAER